KRLVEPWTSCREGFQRVSIGEIPVTARKAIGAKLNEQVDEPAHGSSRGPVGHGLPCCKPKREEKDQKRCPQEETAPWVEQGPQHVREEPASGRAAEAIREAVAITAGHS